jgi:PhzF family phenazine biosynthesis protein
VVTTGLSTPVRCTNRGFAQVDVFASSAGAGNPLAVVLDSEGLDTQQMQTFADWTNLSETTFLLAPTDPAADYRVRIFSPGRELPFAGHPTLGSCFAWLCAGGKPRQTREVIQQCEAGLVRIRQDGVILSFAAPPRVRSGPLQDDQIALIAQGLGVARTDILHHAWCDNGPRWRAVMLRSADQVLALKPDARVLAGLDVGVLGPVGKVGVIAAHASEGRADFEVRAFFSAAGSLREDPVTGSLNAAIGQWLTESGLAPRRYVVSQGTALGRAGRVYIERSTDETVWVGGEVLERIAGTVRL